ncbi:anthrone oxygenase family protein [Saccharothrix syringae]|uniref:anthrone oxygenase family protein n=1 Tax=Saccharothrix syringae TaxID=103733 RepID=UPI000A507DA5|nr:anthrone oxygenase family protein [Saccharothrix syringae]
MFPTVTIIAALGCGTMAGVFFAFSAMVVPGLRRATPAEGVAAMRAINAAVLNPAFLGVFLGTAVASVLAAFGGDPRAWAGAALYLLGGIVLTAAYHVPRNDELERVATPEYWARYLREWVPANHVRALASLAASAAFVLAALHQAGPAPLPSMFEH